MRGARELGERDRVALSLEERAEDLLDFLDVVGLVVEGTYGGERPAQDSARGALVE